MALTSLDSVELFYGIVKLDLSKNKLKEIPSELFNVSYDLK